MGKMSLDISLRMSYKRLYFDQYDGAGIAIFYDTSCIKSLKLLSKLFASHS